MVEGRRKGDLLDFLGRSKGLVANAYRITVPEARRIFSACWLGAETGFFPAEAREVAIRLLSTMDEEEFKQDETSNAVEQRERRAKLLQAELGHFLV